MLLERYEISEDTIITIGEFSILWCRFEQVYFSMNATSIKLSKLANQIQIDKKFSELYTSVKSNSIKYLGCTDELTIQNRIYSERNPGKDDERQHIYNFLNGNSSQTDWIGCLLYIQRIRNNLFHGLKELYSLNDQKEMFISICELLNYILVKEHL